MATAYPTQYPNPQISGYAMSVDMGLSRVNFESGIARQRRRYTNMPHALQLSFVMNLDTLQSWQDWVNDNCYLDFVTIPAPTYLSPTLCAYTTMRFTSGLSIQPLAGEENYFVVTVTAEMIPAADAVGGGGDPNNGGVPFIPPFGPILPDGETFLNTANWPYPDDPVYPAFGRMGIYDPQVLGEDAIYAVDMYVDLVPLADGKQYLYAACDAMTGLSGANGKALRIIDVTNPLAMTDVSTLELVHAGNNVRAHAVEKDGNTLIIKFQTDSSAGLGQIGLMTVNVTDPAAPAILESVVARTGVLPTDKIGSGLMLLDAASEIFVNGFLSGDVFSVNDYAGPAFTTLSEVNVSGSNFQDRFTRVGNTGYASAGAFLYVIDLTSAPTLTFTTVTFNSITGAGPTHGHLVTSAGDYLYAIDAALGILEVWDISTPATPTFAGEVQNAGLVGALDINISSTWVFGLTLQTGFSVDVRNVAVPAFLHNYPGFWKTTRLEAGWNRWLFAAELRGNGRILAQQYFVTGMVAPIDLSLLTSPSLGNINTATAAGPISGQNAPMGVFIRPDGSQLFLSGQSPRAVSTYDLATAFDISTATLVAQSDPLIATVVNGLTFNPAGTRMAYLDDTGDDLFIVELLTPWDLTTFQTAAGLLLNSGGPTITSGRSVCFNESGSMVYVLGSLKIAQFELGTPYTFDTTPVFVGQLSLVGTPLDGKATFGLAIRGEQVIVCTQNNQIYALTMVGGVITTAVTDQGPVTWTLDYQPLSGIFATAEALTVISIGPKRIVQYSWD